MPQDDSVFEERLVLFLDFLGFSNEISRLDEKQARHVRDILIWLADSKSDFSAKPASRSDGGLGRQIIPSLTAFSDNIVASYPAQGPDEYKGLDEVWINDIVLNEMRRMVAAVSARSLKINLLVRGGIARGSLYHSGGVVFGKGMVDAYHLESKVANYPRIVISPKVFTGVNQVQSIIVQTDNDGIRHLNYFRETLKRFIPEGIAEEYPERMTRAIAECNVIIDRNIGLLSSAGKLSEFAKWSWFKDRVSEAAQSYLS